ncbi:fungal specific transcription factor domain-containing protein [Colletotrichum incanum]|uniref:Fungal specific transcription factor domain-containing protein n=1 Tax=Colletotrichum incanum TaxID=1573173 RepID=A0A166UCY8_COLIC|nr:fungal specific transcription factor domain-containing protein [Colletotrichum incanum]
METKETDHLQDGRPLQSRIKLPPSNFNLIFGRQKLDSPSMLHPSAVQSFRLWQIYTSNVHPLTKILHGPSVQEEILRSLSEPSSVDGPTEALVFSIYLVAVISLTDEECRDLLGESREKHLARYRHATEAALSKVDFLRSTNLKVLQAFTLYLLSLRHLCDYGILWLLIGLATRMGQRMGLHRESSLKDLPPFEAKLRRRVWWQIIILDGRTAQLTGASLSPEIQLCGDTKQPVNVNDGDLVPSMSSLPPPSPVTTEMVFCSVRIEIGVWMIQRKCLLGLATTPERKTKFLKSIDELEDHIEGRYLQNIDADIPLNLLTIHLARSAVCQLRLSVYHPSQILETAAALSPEQLDMLLENSLKVVRYDVTAHSTESLQPYSWHITNFFPFETFVLLNSTLTGRPTSQIVDAAWFVINQVYEHHPCFILDTSDPLYWALGNLTLKAWNQRVASARANGLEPVVEPPCIVELVRRRAALSRNSQYPQQARTAKDSTGPATPQSLHQIRDFPRDDGYGLNASHPWPLQENNATMATTGEELRYMTEGMDMDWGFWKELLDSNAQAARNAQETSSFSSFTNIA